MSGAVPGPGADDDWFEQLRDAVVSGADAPETPELLDAPAPPEERSTGNSASGPTLAGVAGVRAAVQAIDGRMTAIETAVDEIAQVVRRASAGPGVDELETMIARVLHAELPALLDAHLASAAAATQVELAPETLERWADQAGDGPGAPGDMVVLAAELRARVAQLEELQRQSFAQLADDRRALIDDAVREIRTMLFGQ